MITTILFNSVCLCLIAFIMYWFWISRPKLNEIKNDESINIQIANGAYSPARLSIPERDEVVITFIRNDQSPCAEVVSFSSIEKEFNIPLDKPTKISLGHLAKGRYPFHCHMKMYQGELEVRDQR